MKKILKGFGIVLGGLVGLIALATGLVFITTQGRLNKVYTLNPSAPALPSDAAAITEGQRLATIRGCTGCHATDLGGRVFIDGAPGHIIAPNLTAGKGGIASTFSDVDWVRAVRHGVGPDGQALWIMPAQDFRNMSDEDLGKIIAFVKSAPSVDRELGSSRLGLLFRVLFAAGQLPLLPAETIDHAATITAPSAGVTVEYGHYLATTCTGCHRPNFAGGSTPGSAPGDPPAANLTSAGNLKHWTEAQFITALRTGHTPEDKQINPENMPWPAFAQMKDDELKAIWLYLQTLPAMLTEKP